jgi:hypothetical protein
MECRLCGLMEVGLRRRGDIVMELSAKACCRRRGSGGAAVLARARRWRRLRRCVARRRRVSGGYVKAISGKCPHSTHRCRLCLLPTGEPAKLLARHASHPHQPRRTPAQPCLLTVAIVLDVFASPTHNNPSAVICRASASL